MAANAIQLQLDLINNITAPIRQVQAQINQMIVTIQNSKNPLKAVQQAFADVGRGAVALARNGIAVIDQKIQDHIRSIERLQKQYEHLTKFGQNLQNFGTKLSLAITLPLAAVAGIGLNAAMNMEQLEVAFTTMIGSAETAQQTLAELRAEAARTPFQFEDYANAARSLIAFGTEADKVTGTLRRIGDISAGVGSSIGEIAELYGKAQVQGRIFSEDINQLTGRGIPIIQELAKQFNVTESQVKKLVETGQVGFANIEEAFRAMTSEGGKFFGLTDKQSQTLAGRISTLRDTFTEMARNMAQYVVPTVSQVVDALTKLFTWMNNLPAPVKAVIAALAGVAAAAGPVIAGVGTLLTMLPMLQAGWAAVSATMLPLLGPAGILALAAIGYIALSGVVKSYIDGPAKALIKANDLHIEAQQRLRTSLVITTEAERQNAIARLKISERLTESLLKQTENRIAQLEAELIAFSELPWWKQIFGSFSANAAFKELETARGEIERLKYELGDVSLAISNVTDAPLADLAQGLGKNGELLSELNAEIPTFTANLGETGKAAKDAAVQLSDAQKAIDSYYKGLGDLQANFSLGRIDQGGIDESYLRLISQTVDTLVEARNSLSTEQQNLLTQLIAKEKELAAIVNTEVIKQTAQAQTTIQNWRQLEIATYGQEEALQKLGKRTVEVIEQLEVPQNVVQSWRQLEAAVYGQEEALSKIGKDGIKAVQQLPVPQTITQSWRDLEAATYGQEAALSAVGQRAIQVIPQLVIPETVVQSWRAYEAATYGQEAALSKIGKDGIQTIPQLAVPKTVVQSWRELEAAVYGQEEALRYVGQTASEVIPQLPVPQNVVQSWRALEAATYGQEENLKNVGRAAAANNKITKEQADTIKAFNQATQAANISQKVFSTDISNGNSILQTYYEITADLLETVPIIGPAMAEAARAVGSLLNVILGDMSNGVMQIRKEVEDLAKSSSVLSQDIIQSIADENTKRVSRGGLLGFLGFTKAELDREAFETGISIATNLANAAVEGLLNGGEAFVQSFDTFFRRIVAEAIIMSEAVQKQILVITKMIQDALVDGVIDINEQAAIDAQKAILQADLERRRIAAGLDIGSPAIPGTPTSPKPPRAPAAAEIQNSFDLGRLPQSVQMAVYTPLLTAIDKFSMWVERLISEGIKVETNVSVNDKKEKTSPTTRFRTKTT